MNQLMSRLFSAMENGETQLVDQVTKDIATAKETGSLDTEEYKLTSKPDGTVEIKDKINKEVTTAKDMPDGIKLVEDKEATKKLQGETEQKAFTRANHRFVVLDEEGKRKFTTNRSGAPGAIQGREGWTAIQEYEYNRRRRQNLEGFSPENIKQLSGIN